MVIFFHFPDSSPSVLNGLHFYFSLRDSASRELNLLRQNGRLVTEVRRHVTMVAKFLDQNNRELKQGEQLKSNNVI